MKENTQTPEARIASDGKILDVHSMFYTLQGEGPFTGVPSIFIRLAGCNLQCPGCDTEYTQGRHLLSVSEIVDEVLAEIAKEGQQHCGLIVITGGEPFRQNIDLLLKALAEDTPCLVQVETNGVLGISGEAIHLIEEEDVFVIVSPKTSKIHESCRYATAFKYVLEAGNVAEDGLPITALRHKASPRVARPPEGFSRDVYINPMDSNDEQENKANLLAVRDSCLKHGYTAGVQLHKLLGVE